MLIRFRPNQRGTEHTMQFLDRELFRGNPGNGAVLGPQRPNDATSYEHLTRTPLYLALLLIALAIGSAAHLLMTSVRRHRRDLALLKTLGFTRHQVSTAVFAQASTLIGVALVVAVPVGVISGRWLWATTAHSLGIPVSQPVPITDILIVIIGAVAVANLLAFIPGRLASRIRPSVALRTE
jgi:ABC-type antimicrobial peptide transport system permease subunit